MNLGEWTLITFTVLAQMSVGTFVLLGWVHWYAQRKAGVEAADRLSTTALLAIGPTLVLGMIASVFHLGDPLRAPLAITRFATSWLSREIAFGVLFAAAGAIFAIMQWRKIGSWKVRNAIALLAALFGLALVYSMSQVYMLGAQPAWNTAATPLQFFTTTFLLGALAVGVALLISYKLSSKKDSGPHHAEQSELLRKVVQQLALISLVLLGVELVIIPLYLTYLGGSGNAFAAASSRILFSRYNLLLATRLVAVFLGAGVFGFFLYRAAQRSEGEIAFGPVLYGAFALVLVAEVIGRFLFYATNVRIGV